MAVVDVIVVLDTEGGGLGIPGAGGGGDGVS